MKNRLLLKLFAFAVIVGLAFTTSCKDYDDDITKLNTELSALKADMVNKSDLNALKTDLEGKITALQTEVNTLKGDLSKYATKAELDAAKADILSKTVALESYNTFKTWVEGEITKLKADVAKAATKDELQALETLLNSKIADLRTDLAAHIANFDALKLVVDGHSTAIADIKGDLADQLALINANKDEIAAVKADLQAKYNALSDLIEALEGRVVSLEGRAGSLEAAVEAIKGRLDNAEGAIADLLDAVAALDDRLEVVEGKVVNLESGLAALDTKVEAYKAELDAKIAALSARVDGLEALLLNVYRDLDHRVYTLTFIPDYTSPDGTPQIVVRGITEWQFHKPATQTASNDWYSPGFTSSWNENWAVKYKGKIYKGVTILRYDVSPSNVKLTDFQVKQLVHKTSFVRYADTESAPIALAGQATLANGVLSVPVVVEANDYDMDTFGSTSGGQVYASTRATVGPWGNNVSVALQVENINVAMDNNEQRIVTSTEYIKCNFDLSEGRIALNEKSLKPDGTILPVGIEYDAIAAAAYASDIKLWNGKSQSGSMTDVLNHTINLNDYIYGVFDDYYGDWEKMKEFGFNTHVFKFRRVYLESEGVNQTNDYVTLNETTGVIGVKPAGQEVNQAAVGRTPIIEVTALVNGKVHAVGYIKIIVTDNFDATPVKFEFTLADYVLGCNSTYKLTDVDIDAIDFDQIFNHPRIQLGKDAFFAEYKQGNLTEAQVTKITPPTPAAATVGIDATKHVWFKYAINPQTQSVNLYNYLEGNIRNDAPAGTYKVKTVLKSNGFRPDVEIIWNFKVVLPTGISLTANTIYYKNGGIVVNPTIMEQGALTSTAYEALLNNTFMHQSNSFVYTGLTEACQEYLTPYFVFTEVPSGFTISTDKKSVWKGTQKAAEIVQVGAAFYIRLQTIGINPPAGPWGNHPPFSDAAKQLVGQSVKVQPRASINGQALNVINLFDPFTVQFTYPLTLQFPSNAQVFDQANDGVKNIYTLNLYNPTVIKDWNGKLISVLTPEGRDLIAHYEIDFEREWIPGGWWVPGTTVYYSPFVLGEPQINLNPDGTIGDTFHPIPMGTDMKIVISNVVGDTYTNPLWGTFNTPASITLKWTNSSTGAVQNEFKVRIPVSVKHKWSPANKPLIGYLDIAVKPGNGN